MSDSSKTLTDCRYNPPLRVLSQEDLCLAINNADFSFARPKLRRQVAHERVSQYFRKPRLTEATTIR